MEGQRLMAPQMPVVIPVSLAALANEGYYTTLTPNNSSTFDLQLAPTDIHSNAT